MAGENRKGDRLFIALALLFALIAVAMVFGVWMRQDFPQAITFSQSSATPNLCLFPCSYGVVPGQTTRDQAKQFLSASPNYLNGRLVEDSSRLHYPILYWYPPSGRYAYSIFFGDDVVDSIILDSRGSGRTVADLLRGLAEPQKLSVNDGLWGDHLYANFVSFFYTDKRIIAQLVFRHDETPRTYTVQPNLTVEVIYFLTEKEFTQRISGQSSMGGKVQDWQGTITYRQGN